MLCGKYLGEAYDRLSKDHVANRVTRAKGCHDKTGEVNTIVVMAVEYTRSHNCKFSSASKIYLGVDKQFFLF